MLEITYLNPSAAAACDSAWECYRAGYAGPPWNEWKKCLSCEHSFGLEIGDKTACPDCGAALTAFWPKEQVAADILDSLKRYRGVCILAVQGATVLGLTLGYAIPEYQLGEELGLTGVNGFSYSGLQVMYQDEIVVRPAAQGQGIGRRLYEEWHRWVQTHGNRPIYARTLSDPPTVVYSWYQRLGYRIVCRYPEPDQRVILRLESQ